jgi:hypothetical protein
VTSSLSFVSIVEDSLPRIAVVVVKSSSKPRGAGGEAVVV